MRTHPTKPIRINYIAIIALLASVNLVLLQPSYSQEIHTEEQLAQENSQQDNPNETFLLNLKNVDIRSLIETVSLRTGKNFIVDPRVKATVNMISSVPINQKKLYEIFLSVLEVHGYAAVTSGEIIKIVPSAIGAQTAIPVLDDSANSGAELISRVIVMQSMPVQQMVETLRPLLPESASISAESNSNTIIVTDRADNIDKLISLINLMDRN